jgi:hypothetical protein
VRWTVLDGEDRSHSGLTSYGRHRDDDGRRHGTYALSMLDYLSNPERLNDTSVRVFSEEIEYNL